MIDRNDAPAGELIGSESWSPDLRAALVRMLAEHGRHAPGYTPASAPVAAFDWDETCIRGDISETWLTYLAEASGEPLVEAYEEGCRRDKRAAYVRLAEDLVVGRTEHEVRVAVRAAFERGLREGRLAVREAMRELIWALQRSGWCVVVVTASPTAVVRAVAQTYGIAASHVFGMDASVGSDGRYARPILEPVLFRDGKLEVLLRAVGKPPTFAAGDSDGDLRMLRSARHALWVDRGIIALTEEASRAGWWVRAAW